MLSAFACHDGAIQNISSNTKRLSLYTGMFYNTTTVMSECLVVILRMKMFCVFVGLLLAFTPVQFKIERLRGGVELKGPLQSISQMCSPRLILKICATAGLAISS